MVQCLTNIYLLGGLLGKGQCINFIDKLQHDTAVKVYLSETFQNWSRISLKCKIVCEQNMHYLYVGYTCA